MVSRHLETQLPTVYLPPASNYRLAHTHTCAAYAMGHIAEIHKIGQILQNFTQPRVIRNACGPEAHIPLHANTKCYYSPCIHGSK